MTRSLLSVLACAAFVFTAAAQDSHSSKVQQYIDRYKDIAMAEMQRTGIPASIKLAQGILESGYGGSALATKANNHFGIKCHTGWTGPSMTYDDDEKNECFRKYASAEESYRDHSEFLRTRPRYAFLFEYEPTDYKKWAHGLKQAGYATNPRYAELLIASIEKHNLHQYDVFENFTPSEPAVAKVTKPRKDRKGLGGIAGKLEESVAPKPTPQAASSRVIYVNRVKAVTLLTGETIEQVGRRFDIGTSRVLKYNDLAASQPLPAGTLIYLQPKRRHGDSLYHVVAAGETMHSISQRHGVRLSFLYDKNRMQLGTQPAAGEVLYLRDKRNSPPKLRGEEAPKPLTGPAANSSAVRVAPPVPTENETKANAAIAASPNTLVDVNLQQALQNRYEEIPTVALPRREPQMQLDTLPGNWNADAEEMAGYINVTEQEGLDYYTVKPKDTLYSIAKAYGLSVNQLMEINGLGSDVISAGTRLRVRH